MRTLKNLLGGSLLALTVLPQPAQAAEAVKPIHFGDITWESGSLITEVLRLIVEKGYGLPTDTLPGSTVSLEAALAKDDIQVIGEEWAGRSPAWVKAEGEGKVFGLGDTVKGATEGWWVPEYVIKGDAERGIKPLAPDLKSVADLSRYKDVFRDPEDPSKGRFLNSPTGWTSEIVNSQKLKAYGLTDTFVNFRTGSGAALDAEVASSIRRGKPVLFYYWSPTPLMGQVDLVKLEEKPGVDKSVSIKVGLSKTFHEQAPELVAVLEKVNLPIDLLNQNLGRMAKERIESPKLAKIFLKEHPEVWHAWVSNDAAKKVDAAL